MNKLNFLLLLLLFSACSIDRTILHVTTIDQKILGTFQNIDKESKLKIAEANEPGERLLLCLTFVNKENQQTRPGQPVHFYQTSVTGEYQLDNPADQSSARLNGAANTDSLGRLYIETILPGDYGSRPDNRHIHTTVFGARPEAYDIHFKQYTSAMGKRFAHKSDQHFLADLKRTQDGTLIAFLTIEVK